MLFEKIQLDADEKVLILVRRHWFILAVQLVGVLFVALTPIIAVYFSFGFYEQNSTNIASLLQTYQPHILFLASLWLLMNWVIVATIWTDYYLDLWLVTNKRIIAIEQKGLFYREVGSFRLERLQDLQVKINGIIATFLDFGTVEAETASGSSDEFRAHYLPKPRELKSLILQASDKRIGGLRDETGV